MDATWFWAVLLGLPALVAACDAHRDETILALGMGALALAGGLLAWPLGLVLALAAWIVPLRRVAGLNARADMARRHAAIMRVLKDRVGVSDHPLPACLRPGALIGPRLP